MDTIAQAGINVPASIVQTTHDGVNIGRKASVRGGKNIHTKEFVNNEDLLLNCKAREMDTAGNCSDETLPSDLSFGCARQPEQAHSLPLAGMILRW